jgi:ABC-type amino acid transport substrate-binding protein
MGWEEIRMNVKRARGSALLLFLSCPAGALLAQDLAEIHKRGTLRVIAERDSQPERFALQADAEPGLEKEILLGFAARDGLKLEIVTVERTEDRIPALLEGKGDVIVGIVVTDARRKVVVTSEVLPTRHVVVTRKPDQAIESLGQLRSHKVGTLKGSSWAEMVAAAGVPAANVDDSFPSSEACLEGLRARRVSAVVMSVAWAVVARNKDPDLEIGVFVGPPTSAAFALRKDAPQLAAELGAYVANVRKTDTWSRLVVKYFRESGLEILKRSRPE